MVPCATQWCPPLVAGCRSASASNTCQLVHRSRRKRPSSARWPLGEYRDNLTVWPLYRRSGHRCGVSGSSVHLGEREPTHSGNGGRHACHFRWPTSAWGSACRLDLRRTVQRVAATPLGRSEASLPPSFLSFLFPSFSFSPPHYQHFLGPPGGPRVRRASAAFPGRAATRSARRRPRRASGGRGRAPTRKPLRTMHRVARHGR